MTDDMRYKKTKQFVILTILIVFRLQIGLKSSLSVALQAYTTVCLWI